MLSMIRHKDFKNVYGVVIDQKDQPSALHVQSNNAFELGFQDEGTVYKRIFLGNGILHVVDERRDIVKVRVKFDCKELVFNSLDEVFACALETVVCQHPNIIQLPNTDCMIPYCQDCNKTLPGWYCPTSPNKRCGYKDNDTFQDDCIYCHQPEERK